MEKTPYSTKNFMDAVREYEYLYDKYSNEYKDLGKKANGWKEVADRFENMSPIQAQKRFKNIRSAFTRALRKQKLTRPGSFFRVPREFANLQWLKPYIEHRSVVCNQLEVKNETGLGHHHHQSENKVTYVTSLDAEYCFDSSRAGQPEADEDVKPVIIQNNSSREMQNRTAQTVDGNSPWPQNENMSVKERIDRAIFRSPVSEEHNLPGCQSHLEDDNDEDSLFFRSLVPRCKRLTDRQRANLRIQIEQLMYLTEFGTPHQDKNAKESEGVLPPIVNLHRLCNTIATPEKNHNGDRVSVEEQ